MPTGNSYCRGVLEGLADYLQAHGPWATVHLNRRLAAGDLRRLGRLDGVVSLHVDRQVLAALRRRGVRRVFVEAGCAGEPRVATDEAVLGRMAAEHFRDLGFRHVAFLADSDTAFGRLRRSAFRAAADRLGMTCADITDELPGRWRQAGWRRRWLAQLPAGTGLFVVTSGLARRVMQELVELARSVPGELAVLTAELRNPEARLTSPALSSIDQATGRIGYQAGGMLDGLLAGAASDRSEAPAVLVPPVRVCARASTDVLAVEDPAVREAIAFLRARATDGVSVADVVRRSRLSRRALEVRFRRAVGRTIHGEIVRVRLAEAKRLLAETKLPLPDIAVRVGYEHASNLCAVFRRELATRPGAFRSRPER